MARSTQAERYLRIRRWVDRDIDANGAHATAFYGPTIATGVAFALIGYYTGPVERASDALFWMLVWSPWIGWMAFVIWRTCRLIRADVIRGDRAYDRRGKYLLPPEYAHTESFTAAERRKRRRSVADH